MVVRTALAAAERALDAEGYAVLASDLKKADEALERIMDSWEIKKDLLSKSSVRIAELDATVRQQSKFGQEQHAYIVELEAALERIAHMDDSSADRNDDLIYGAQATRIARAALEGRRLPTGDGSV